MTANTTAPAAAQLTTANEERDALHPCACSFVHVEGEDLRCTRTTSRTFAPGHDAQLKSRLVAAELGGLTVRRVGPDGKFAETTVALAAGEHGFGYQVTNAVVRARRLQAEKDSRRAARDLQREANRATREAAKAEAKAKRDAAKAAKQAESVPQVAKVGRWEYPGTVVADGSFAYVAKDGSAKVAAPGKYELVSAA